MEIAVLAALHRAQDALRVEYVKPQTPVDALRGAEPYARP
tara:strand:+ start:728 stop:847 length:120 start_codon:yes stop_codon:yes gene_type:complete